MMQNAQEIKQKILRILREQGPTFPVPIASKVGMQSLFVSAFLSELLSEQQLRITNLKVGGSPIYYIPGQESQLEKFSEHLKSKEKEAYLLLKENKFLEDEPQHPAIRVALRQIKDYAKPFKLKNTIIWRYFLNTTSEYQKQRSTSNPQPNTPEPQTIDNKQQITYNNSSNSSLPKSFISDIQNTISQNEKPKEKTPSTAKPQIPIPKTESIPPKSQIATQVADSNQQSSTFANPLAKIEEVKKSKEKPKSAFVQRVIRHIEKNNWVIIQEIDYKLKEYNALIQINSDLGPIIFKAQAKDKKTISEADMSKLLGEAQAIPLPALIMSVGDVQKKATDFLETYTSVLKFSKIE